MDLNLDEISKLVTISKPFIDPLLSVLLKPKLEKLSKWIKKEQLKNDLTDNFFENKFTEYLAISLRNYTNVNMLIFQNQQIKIESIYYPLTISASRENAHYEIDNFERKLFDTYGKVLISDNAGMGKSTLSKWMCKKAIEQGLAIPILIELRNLKDSFTVLDEIFFQINPLGDEFDKDLILKFLELGNFLIVFDGFDEIQLKNQEQIIKDLRTFVNKVPNNWFLLTSRPEGALASFGDFQMFKIQALDPSEAFELIKKYDEICPIKISENLIRDIKGRFNQVQGLLGNPFLVSLLYSTYTFNKDIPASKVSFYEEIYFALYKRHDLSKDGWTRPKKSGLDIQQFRIVLRQLAFDTSLLGETNYSETELIDLIDIAVKKSPGIETKSYNFLEDLILTVPLFQRDGLKIKWAHKSIQDFFSAEYIAYDTNKESFLNILYDKKVDSFNNILTLLLELDFKTFRKTIIKRLLSDYIAYYDNSYKELSLIIEQELIDERKAKTFGMHVVFFLKKESEDVSLAFESIHKSFPEIGKSLNSSIIYSGKYQRVFVCSSNEIGLINILASTIKPKYIKTFLSDPERNETDLRLENDKFYKIDDSPHSMVNSIELFSQVNKELPLPDATENYNIFYCLDYIESKKELVAIEDDIEQEAELSRFNFKKGNFFNI